MSTVMERRYRRVLRLLPSAYRQQWEEDMVSAFMDSAGASRRPALAEHLSVVALAVRVRLDGSRATPRGMVLYHVVHGIALIVLLYQALSATVWQAFTVRYVVETIAARRAGAPTGSLGWDYFVIWTPGSSLLWIAAFGCFVLGRFVAARVFVLLAFGATIAATVHTYAMLGAQGSAGTPFGYADVSRWGWLAVSVAVVFVTPQHVRTARPFWLCAYFVGSLALVSLSRLELPLAALWVRTVNLTNLTSAALMLAMIVALAGALAGRNWSLRWLLALALFAGGFEGIRLLMTAFVQPHNDVLYIGQPPPYWAVYQFVINSLDIAPVALAVVCAVFGVIGLRRYPSRSHTVHSGVVAE